jgi:ribonuclease PH
LSARADGRRPDHLRPLDLQTDFLVQPHGSVLWTQGKTRVLCTASIQEGVPRWLYRQGRGWLTAEYSMLPASTGDRRRRAASRAGARSRSSG